MENNKQKHNYVCNKCFKSARLFVKKYNKYIIITTLILCIIGMLATISSTRIEITTNNENISFRIAKRINYEEIKPNEAGDILVIMYHSLDTKKNHYPWHTTKEEFLRDLEYMYNNGYVLISMKEYLSNDIDIPAGKTPILLTFDDGLKSCFSLKKDSTGKLVLNSNSLIGMLEKFKLEHPDFGSGGVLYITADPFDHDAYYKIKSEGSYEDKFRVLSELGYEIGNHTYNHPGLSGLSKKELTKEIGKVNNLVYKYSKLKTQYLAYPYGIKPDKKNMNTVKSGTYKKISYNIQSAVLAAPEPPYFTNPIKKDFKRYYISRAIATKGDYMDMYWMFNYYKKHPDKKYISDGDKRTLSIPVSLKDKINTNKIKGLHVTYYDKKTFEIIK